MSYINMDWHPPDPEPGYSWPKWYLDQIKAHRARQAEERRKQDGSDLLGPPPLSDGNEY